MKIERVTLYKNHILLDRGEVILIDTGSPGSFHINRVIDFGGMEHHCPSSTFGIDCEYLSEQLGRPIAGLLGMDILNKFDNVGFDYPNNQILTNCDIDSQNLTFFNAGNVAGILYVDLQIDGRSARMFVDTGAPVSYISEDFTADKNSIDEVEDFHPSCGNFLTKIYNLPVSIKNQDIKMNFGNLPSLIQTAIGAVGVDGIIGYELFSRYKIILHKDKLYI